jgi:hypothetical protein
MFTYVRVLCTLFMNRYRALREDEGASTVEWVALILIGVGVAGAVALIVRNAAQARANQITGVSDNH